MGAVSDQQYNGEGWVTGPGTGSKSLTLGDSDGATASNTNSSVNSSYDTFLSNTTDGSTQVSNQITLQFKGFTGDTITINSFDFEIFPCQNGYEGCTSPPDMTFQAGNNTNGKDANVSSFGTSGVLAGVEPNTTNGNATLSPNGSAHNTAYDQYIGTWNTGYTLSQTGNFELDFLDWPATIGVDNLSITYTDAVPEPASIAFLGTLVVLVTKKLRRS
jgi:hypothetical protein